MIDIFLSIAAGLACMVLGELIVFIGIFIIEDFDMSDKERK